MSEYIDLCESPVWETEAAGLGNEEIDLCRSPVRETDSQHKMARRVSSENDSDLIDLTLDDDEEALASRVQRVLDSFVVDDDRGVGASQSAYSALAKREEKRRSALADDDAVLSVQWRYDLRFVLDSYLGLVSSLRFGRSIAF